MLKICQSVYVGDECWNNMQYTLMDGKQPFKYIDRLAIAFADLNVDDLDHTYLEYVDDLRQKRVRVTKELARKQNPGIELIAQMNYARDLHSLIDEKDKAETRVDNFAKSIPNFLKQYGLQGIDFDWESLPSNMTKEYATLLFTQTRWYLENDKSQDAIKNPIMSISPNLQRPEWQSLDVAVVNRLFDAVHVQSYVIPSYIDDYVDAGVDKSILFCGVCSERGSYFAPNSDIAPFTQEVDKYDLPGLYCWRADNDDTDTNANGLRVPRYTITTKLTSYARGTPPDPPLYP